MRNRLSSAVPIASTGWTRYPRARRSVPTAGSRSTFAQVISSAKMNWKNPRGRQRLAAPAKIIRWRHPAKPKKKRKPSAQADEEPRKPRKKRKKLTADMRRKKRKTYSRRDLDGGIQLLLGIVGKLLAGGNFMDVVSGLLGGMVGGIAGGDTRSAGERLAASGIGADQIAPSRRTTSTTHSARTSSANCVLPWPGPRTGSTLEIG